MPLAYLIPTSFALSAKFHTVSTRVYNLARPADLVRSTHRIPHLDSNVEPGSPFKSWKGTT